jgi:hypothetical protein
VPVVARPSRLYVPLSEKLDRLLDHLDNCHTMHGSQGDALEWVRMDRKDTRHYSGTMLLGL